ncbi:sulfotransferase domain-containing protein [Phaeodactylibacter sp.]|uniref:sulfotransferase domain-containing protein n=1 Tax=Phaeodactylibacter sp. TaxID=1940289 RepID=UPI0025D8BACF|nr:sulfotransferase domain-containing protein [Phaeodactylibacter sp.]MCI5055371.1 sulfotransferase [Flavobacteriales bacterium]MCI5090783.1 sulfotransferase [Phaeodactylibacter sp.]
MPRSGSTWLGSIIDSHPSISYKMQPLFSYSLKGYLDDYSNYSRIQSFKNQLLNTESDFIDQIEKKKRNIIPVFKKSTPKVVAYKETRYHYILENLLRTDKESYVVCLIRNPLAHLYSWLNAPKEFRHELGWKIEEEWLLAPKKNQGRAEEYYGYQKWKETTIMFHSLQKAYPDRCLIINYSDLLRTPMQKALHIFSFLGLQIHQQTKEFIKESRSKNDKDPYGVYKDKKEDNSWQGKLPGYIVDYVQNDLAGTRLESYITS